MARPQFRKIEITGKNEDIQKQLPTMHKAIAEQNTVPLPVLQQFTPSDSHKKGSNFSIVQDVINAILARLYDPQPEGLNTRGLRAVKPGISTLASLPVLSLTTASGLLIVSFSFYISRYGDLALEFFFLVGLIVIFLPSLIRLLSPTPERFERLCLLCVLGTACFLIKFMMSPLYFTPFDPMLHWRTADDILRTTHLFNQNSLLPVSPYYPGLEIVTNALSTVSGLNTFVAGNILISAARLLMVLSLFALYEIVTRSSRMAGIATMLYMTNPHFLSFDASYSYETLALPLAIFLFYILARSETLNKSYVWILFTALLVLLAVTLTHHVTNYVFDALFTLWALVSLFQTSAVAMRRSLITIALCGLLLSLAYAFLFKGNPVWQYLSSYFGTTFNELARIITGTSTARPLFASQGASPAPIWDRLLMIASVALVAFCLPFGLLSIWRQQRHDALAVTFGIASLAYPFTQVFRFTNFGSEITDRSAAFLFLPVAYVLTIFITHFWPTRGISRRAIVFISSAIVVVLVGGVIINSGPSYSALPGHYEVVADLRSVEPDTIQAAQWSLSSLGPDNRIGTDRDTQTLFSTFGEQTIVTQLENNVAISPVFFATHLDQQEVEILRQAKVRYLVVDLRLSTSLPILGFYFEPNERSSFHQLSPISRKALTKFNTIPYINCVYDNGNIVIYDVGTLINRSGGS